MVLQLSRRPRISIHTPTKGVTLIIDLLSPLTFDFNPHSHEGSDTAVPLEVLPSIVFQSTLPRRE